MSLADLKIQLEGMYERAEAEVARWEAAAAELEHLDWTSHRDWRAFLAGPVDREALDAVERRARTDAHPELLPLVARFDDAEHRTHRLLTEHLAMLGEWVAYESLERKLDRLRDHLPAVMARSYGRGVPFAKLLGRLKPEWAPLEIIVTKKVLVANGKTRRLDQILLVTVQNAAFDRCRVTVHVAGLGTDEWEMNVSPSELLDALSARGIPIERV